jgi:hypothetical protein
MAVAKDVASLIHRMVKRPLIGISGRFLPGESVSARPAVSS